MNCKNCAASKTCKDEAYMADDVFIKPMPLIRKGDIVPQHRHVYDHTTLVAKGKVSAYKIFQRSYNVDGSVIIADERQKIGTFEAPYGIWIEANISHFFVAEEDDTLLFCIHNVSRTKKVETTEKIGGECHSLQHLQSALSEA